MPSFRIHFAGMDCTPKGLSLEGSAEFQKIKWVTCLVPDPDLPQRLQNPLRRPGSNLGSGQAPLAEELFLEQPGNPGAPRLSNVPADWKPVIAGLLGMLAPVKLPAINFPDSLFKREPSNVLKIPVFVADQPGGALGAPKENHQGWRSVP